jgi:hypothetical protein
MDNENDFRTTYDRHKEFNFDSEINLKGFEWRSPNMTGIKTWSEFEEYINILYGCVFFLCKKALKYSVVINPNKALLNMVDKNNISHSIEEIKQPQIRVFKSSIAEYKRTFTINKEWCIDIKDNDCEIEKHIIRKNYSIKVKQPQPTDYEKVKPQSRSQNNPFLDDTETEDD